MNEQNTLLEWALYYAALGWPIFPVHTPLKQGGCSCGKPCSDVGKHPRIKGWQEKATTDEATIRRWWKRWPDANIGLAAGGASGVFMLDQDNEAGAAYIAERGHAPCPTVITGKGKHRYFLHPGFPVRNLVKLAPNMKEAGIDTRGDGGLSILPPSRHASGRLYRWEVLPTDCPAPPGPDWLLDLLRPQPRPTAAAPREATRGALDAPGEALDARRAAYAEKVLGEEVGRLAGAVVGERNATLFEVTARVYELVGAGLVPDADARQAIEGAAYQCGLIAEDGAGAFERTLESGIRHGLTNPSPSFPDFSQDRPRTNGSAALQPQARAARPALRLVDQATGEVMEGGDGLPPDFNLFAYQPEDGGLLDAWLDLYGEAWRFAAGWDVWLYWTGTHWQRDESHRLGRQVHDLIDALNQHARDLRKQVQARLKEAAKLDISDPAIAAQVEALNAQAKALGAYVSATKRTNGRIESVVNMASKQRAIEAGGLDGGNVLNLANGTLDLARFALRPHRREDHQTYVLPYAYDPRAACPRWLQFLGEVLVTADQEPDAQLLQLYQELFGYSLTADTKHEKMVWQSGEGGNGKTVAIKVLGALLGPLAAPVDFQTLGAIGNYDLASLPGKRVIFSTESERGGKIAEGLLRRVVSGEEIPARAIYGTPFTLRPVCKVWWAMNDLPTVRDTSNATWRRLELIPFNRTFTDQDKDPDLADKLLGELPGVLNWAMQGLERLRQQRRFTEALAVRAAVAEVRKESNPVAQWMEERTVRGAHDTPAGKVYANYRQWCEATGRSAMNDTNFGRELKRLGIPKKRTNAGNVYSVGLAAGVTQGGIDLEPPPAPPPPDER